MSQKRAILTQGHGLPNGGRPSGWYPDPHDTGGLRYWNGRSWTDHRARLAVPSNAPAVCDCGVAATGSCRVCNRPYCRAHISDQDRDDRAYLTRWEAWTCHGCIEGAQRMMRVHQLSRCEEVSLQFALHATLHRMRTITGHKPRLVNLFQRNAKHGGRHVRRAVAYLIQYDGDADDASYTGLAVTPDGRTVFDVGIPTVGVRKDRGGPKHNIPGYLITEEISLDRLRIAADRPTKETWFEFASRVYLRAAERLGITPGLPEIEPFVMPQPKQKRSKAAVAELEPTSIAGELAAVSETSAPVDTDNDAAEVPDEVDAPTAPGLDGTISLDSDGDFLAADYPPPDLADLVDPSDVAEADDIVADADEPDQVVVHADAKVNKHARGADLPPPLAPPRIAPA